MIRMTAAEFREKFGKSHKAKYRNEKCSWGGKDFPSRRERDRYIQLYYDQQDGVIRELRTQVKFALIPAQRIDGKLVEREVSYIADFVYRDRNGNLVVEDSKGFRTREYVIKRKMMLEKYGIKIVEV